MGPHGTGSRGACHVGGKKNTRHRSKLIKAIIKNVDGWGWVGLGGEGGSFVGGWVVMFGVCWLMGES